MKAFWWFEENKIAGMARPGFNHCRWFDLPFNEALVMGWIGQHSAGSIPLKSFHHHVETYGPKVSSFYPLTEEQRQSYFQGFKDPNVFMETVSQLAERSRFISTAKILDDHLHFEIHQEQLDKEIDFLRNQGIKRIVSLTEEHHVKNHLNDSFDLHHISIIDMGAPTVDQAYELKEILEEAEEKQEKVAVHCLAGIGRTSTLLMAAEMLRGKTIDSVLEKISKQNPTYSFVGAQAEFVRSLAILLKEAKV